MRDLLRARHVAPGLSWFVAAVAPGGSCKIGRIAPAAAAWRDQRAARGEHRQLRGRIRPGVVSAAAVFGGPASVDLVSGAWNLPVTSYQAAGAADPYLLTANSVKINVTIVC